MARPGSAPRIVLVLDGLPDPMAAEMRTFARAFPDVREGRLPTDA